MIWDTYKKQFSAWEGATTKLLEGWLKSPLLLEPTGAVLGGLVKLRSAQTRMQNAWLNGLGLATRRDQERTLHLLHELESRLYDLQERLDNGTRNQNGG